MKRFALQSASLTLSTTRNAHGVVHRDLKPENILMQHGQPVIADFGIALAISKAGGSRVTQTGLSLGTPQYMSPEQATGDRVIDGLFRSATPGDRTITPVLATDADELSPRISPDGKWMAYVSAESGQDEVYVRSFPGTGGRTLVSLNGGREPLWSRDGRTIYYSNDGAYLAAAVALSGTPTVARRDTVTTGPYASWRFHPLYDVAPDGKHLLVLEPSQKDVPATVILNWGSAFARRVGSTK